MLPIENDGNTVPVKKTIQPHEVDGVLDSLWASFCGYMGLPTEDTPNPKIGYKFETDVSKRDEYFGRAIRMRNKYADLMSKFGKDHDRLDQMTRELTEAKRGASWEK